MTKFTPANVESLIVNPAWEELVIRLEKRLLLAEIELEQPGEFFHGKGVGARAEIRLILDLPQQLAKEAAGESFVQKLKRQL